MNTSSSRQDGTSEVLAFYTAVSKRVKELYNYRCQVCGIRIECAGVAYAEGAHIQPLGLPHGGPDTPDNVLCFCPNHHVMFDFGILAISDALALMGVGGKLQIHPKHNVGKQFLKHHRERYNFNE